MRTLHELFDNNRRWAAAVAARDPRFFEALSQQQSPKYLWIGCADSRVPANEIVGLRPGELFVHRNVANLVVHTDLNCLAVLQYALDLLHVEHVIVCGHYGCGGVQAAAAGQSIGLADNWLRHVHDVRERHAAALHGCADAAARVDRLCELNVVEQVRNVCRTTVVRDAWARGQRLSVHGWIYALRDGLLRDLDVTTNRPEEMDDAYTRSVGGILSRVQP
ncbi:MAG: carbonate dehydratase [Vicinamibacterales bacterium]